MALLRGSSALWCFARSINTALLMPWKTSMSYCSSVTSAKVEVNGVHLHYQLTGQGNHAILLLPGVMGSGETDFGPQLKLLNKELFTLVALDPRGQGRSIPPNRDYPPYFVEEDAKDAVDLMQALKFKRFSMMGWSLGGTTALVAAAKYPDLIHKVVIWGSISHFTNDVMKGLKIVLDISTMGDSMRKPLEKMYGTEYLSKGLDMFRKEMDCIAKRPDGNLCRDLLPLIKCPTFIIHGQKDNFISLQHVEFIHQQIKGSQLHVMPEGKHNLHLRFAEEFNRLVEDFLK